MMTAVSKRLAAGSLERSQAHLARAYRIPFEGMFLIFVLSLVAPRASACIPIAPGPTPNVTDPSPADCDSMLVEDDPTVTLAGKTPVMLIHGICLAIANCNDSNLSTGPVANGKLYFSDLSAFFSSPGASSQFKVYRFHYKSNLHTIYDIGRSLRNWLDYEIKVNGLAFDTRYYIVAHSMGGLVARSYMNEHDHDTGIYSGRRGGEWIRKLITLATPHHGTPLSNGDARVSSIWHPVWNGTFEGLDVDIWRSILGETVPDRSDMRWDDYDNRTWDGLYISFFEYDNWLAGIPHTYDQNIVAYYGYIGGGDLVYYYGTGGSLDIALAFQFLTGGADYFSLIGVILQRIIDRNFDENDPIITIANDGFVPVKSASFDGSSATPISCSGRNHSEMTENLTCDDGTPLFKSILSQIGGSTTQPSLLSVTPDVTWSFGNIAVNNSGSQAFVLSNNGGSTLTVNSLGLSGANAADFSFVNPPTTPFTVSVGASEAIEVLFRPGASGARSGNFTIASNASNVPSKTISLSGTGTLSNSCTYTISSASQSLGPTSGNSSFVVSAGNTCSWAATANDSWLTITSPSGGSGIGTQSLFLALGQNS